MSMFTSVTMSLIDSTILFKIDPSDNFASNILKLLNYCGTINFYSLLQRIYTSLQVIKTTNLRLVVTQIVLRLTAPRRQVVVLRRVRDKLLLLRVQVGILLITILLLLLRWQVVLPWDLLRKLLILLLRWWLILWLRLILRHLFLLVILLQWVLILLKIKQVQGFVNDCSNQQVSEHSHGKVHN